MQTVDSIQTLTLPLDRTQLLIWAVLLCFKVNFTFLADRHTNDKSASWLVTHFWTLDGLRLTSAWDLAQIQAILDYIFVSTEVRKACVAMQAILYNHSQKWTAVLIHTMKPESQHRRVSSTKFLSKPNFILAEVLAPGGYSPKHKKVEMLMTADNHWKTVADYPFGMRS